MANNLNKMRALSAIRDTLVEQLIRLEQLGESRTAAYLNPAVEHLNHQLGDATSDEEIERLRRKYFMS